MSVSWCRKRLPYFSNKSNGSNNRYDNIIRIDDIPRNSLLGFVINI